MLTQLPSNKATFTQLVSLFLLKTSFCMRRNAQNVYLNLFGSLNLYLNAKSVSKGSFIQYYNSILQPADLMFWFAENFFFSAHLFLFHCNPQENKRKAPTPHEKEKNIFETIAPHARMA